MTYLDGSTSGPSRRHQEAVATERTALALIGDIRDQVGDCYALGLKLDAIAATGRGEARHRKLAEQLVHDIRNARRKLVTVLQNAGQKVRRHSRVHDLKRALSSSEAVAERAVRRLAGEGSGSRQNVAP